MPKVSVIIPVYGVEKYIERCVHSLFSQTLDDLEYIFIDDCSPDNSINIMQDVLKQYPQRMSQVLLIRHEKNQGLAAARTTGMKVATGEYLIHCDPDDWVDKQAYQIMYDLGVANNSDIVICNFIIELLGISVKKTIKKYKTPQDCLKAYPLRGSFYHPCWNKLIRSQLIKKYDIYPLESVNLGEDTNMMCRELHYAKSIIFCDDYLYHYNRMNVNSLTHQKDLRANFEMGQKNTEYMVDFLMKADPKKYKLTINYIKFFCKLKYMRCYPNDYQGFYNFYKECRSDILRFTNEPIRVRLYYIYLLYFPYLSKFKR